MRESNLDSASTVAIRLDRGELVASMQLQASSGPDTPGGESV